MKLVQHPNVVRLYEVIDTQTKLYLILELGDGGDLYDYIMKHERGLNEQEAGYYFSQVLHHTELNLCLGVRKFMASFIFLSSKSKHGRNMCEMNTLIANKITR